MTRRQWDPEWREMARLAAQILRRARGKPRWAVVIEDGTGMRHTGVSVSIPEVPAGSLCAEPIAVAGHRLEGEGDIHRLILVGPPPKGAAPPCGRCLQLLHEFGPGIEVRWGTANREAGRATVRQLLPNAFGDYRIE